MRSFVHLFVVMAIAIFTCGISTVANAQTSPATTKPLSDYAKPTCGSDNWEFKNGNCVLVTAKTDSEEKCVAAKLSWAGDKCVVPKTADSCRSAQLIWAGDKCAAPNPQCNKAEITSLVLEKNECVNNVPTLAKSDTNNYRGDCFRRVAKIPGSAINNLTWMFVTEQRGQGDETTLTVAEANEPSMLWYCRSAKQDAVTIKVKLSELIDNGAVRSGWTYGALALPYKYHFHDRSFTNNVSIGPYIGRRLSWTGTGVTIAGSASIGSVTGLIADSNGKAANAPLTSFGIAFGVMFDVSKGIKPFKAGLFIGQDRVGSASSSAFVHDRKNWLAFQLGFDFTDNY